MADTDLDDRALEALKELSVEGGLAVVKQVSESDLSHVQNKSALLCGVIKTFKSKNSFEASQKKPGRFGDALQNKPVL